MISAMTVFDSESESESDPADTGADTGSAADDATRSARVGALPNLSSSPNKGSFRRGVHPAAVAATGGGSSNSGGGEHGLDSGADVEPERRRRTYSKSCFQRLGKTNKDRMESVRWLDRAFGERSTFGTIRFPNHNKATFVRLSPNTDPKDMIDLMVKLNYSLPRLIISVTGGALDFELSKTVETVLKRGLRKVWGGGTRAFHVPHNPLRHTYSDPPPKNNKTPRRLRPRTHGSLLAEPTAGS